MTDIVNVIGLRDIEVNELLFTTILITLFDGMFCRVIEKKIYYSKTKHTI